MLLMGSHPSSDTVNSVFATLTATEFEHVIIHQRWCFALLFFLLLIMKVRRAFAYCVTNSVLCSFIKINTCILVTLNSTGK